MARRTAPAAERLNSPLEHSRRRAVYLAERLDESRRTLLFDGLIRRGRIRNASIGDMSPRELGAALRTLEQEMGRKRKRW